MASLKITQVLFNKLFWIVLLFLSTYAFPVVFGQNNWTAEFKNLGSLSSPRVTDLNSDGIKDIIIGSGRIEFMPCDSAVIAIDGSTGETIWTIDASDQMFGSAMFLDISDDGIDDIFIGGRSAELIAINGSTGEEIWRFLRTNDKQVIKSRDWFNFYNPQFIPDFDGDGLKDLLICNGGNARIKPEDPNRPVGYIMTISSKTGKLNSLAEMPDARESYFSVSVLEDTIAGMHEVVFGSGGETMPGHLYFEDLNNILKGDLSNAEVIHHSESKGYIGPVARVDITDDGKEDIIVNTVEEKVLAIDGKTHELIWEVHMGKSESYSQPCIGQFTDDDIPDIFITYRRGAWPELNWSIQKMIDGKTGDVLFVDSLGIYQNTSPLAVDLTGDGVDEVVMSLNIQKELLPGTYSYFTYIAAIEFKSGMIVNLTNAEKGTNLSSTPWMGDLDNDGYLDIIYCHGTNYLATYTFDGMRIHRLSTSIPVPKDLQWGAYQGSNYDGIYKD